jgi:hypothetical protein
MVDYRFTCLNCGTHEEPLGEDLPGVCGDVLYWVCRYCGIAWSSPSVSPRYRDLADAMVLTHNTNRESL